MGRRDTDRVKWTIERERALRRRERERERERETDGGMRKTDVVVEETKQADYICMRCASWEKELKRLDSVDIFKRSVYTLQKHKPNI